MHALTHVMTTMMTTAAAAVTSLVLVLINTLHISDGDQRLSITTSTRQRRSNSSNSA